MSNSFDLIPIQDLVLDPQNPRLSEDLIGRGSEVELINWMLESSTLLDLMGSISQNGFF